MMQAFRKFGASKTSKALLYVLVISFGAWGIGGYLVPAIGVQAARVNGEDISPRQIEQTYNQRLQNISQLLGMRPTKEQIDQMQLPEQVLAEVIARTALRQAAEHIGFQPATKQLQAEIAQISAFKNERGQFDVARYRQILAQIGRTPTQFESDMGQDLIVRNLAGLTKVVTPSPSLAAGITGAEHIKLTLEVATLTPADAANLPAPSDADLKAFYEKNQNLYGKPETRNITVLRLSRSDLIASITVPEAEIAQTYEENKEHYKMPETRDVRHILFKTKQDAEQAAAAITSQESFIAAAANSLDTANAGRGGLLGTIKADDVVPAFRKAAFSLPENTLSTPVQSPYGWHLIWVDAIHPEKTMNLADMRDAIAKDLQAAQADEALVRLGGVVDEHIAAGQPLTEIAKTVGVKAHTFSTVRATDEAMEPQELSTAFSLNENEISQPLQMADGGAAYVQTTRISPAAIKPLAEVKDRVIADWRKAQTQTALRNMASKLLTAAQGNTTSLAQSVQKAGLPTSIRTSTVVVSDPVSAPEWLQPNLQALYPLANGNVIEGALPEGSNLHIVRLVSRESLPLDVTKLPEQAKIYQQRLQGDVEALLMAHITQQAKVELNQAQLKNMFGREVQWSATVN